MGDALGPEHTGWRIQIDGVTIPAKPGQTVIQAAEAAGIYIPRLCWHKDLVPSGHCRLCTVRINGRPAGACTNPVADGLVVESDTEELNAIRRLLVEMMFAEGNHYCPTCEASGSCELQALAYRLGVHAPSVPYLYPRRHVDATHRDIYIDRDRCILCGRCVRASAMIDGKTIFGYEQRGIRKRVAVDSAEYLGDTEMDVADLAARVCPTGCITVKRHGYETPVGQRPYDRVPIGCGDGGEDNGHG